MAAAAAAAAAAIDDAKAKLILRQVEFYFSDSNLPRDDFLSKTVRESEGGLVSLELICSFARMRTHLGLSGDEVSEETVKAVAEVLRMSPSLKLSEDGKRVGRSTELVKPEEVLEQVDSRTVAVSPLPFDVRIEELESFFGQHGKVNSVRLPRHVADKRFFCGTALIEFSSEEDAEKLSKESLVYAGAELEIKPKKDFDAEREEKIVAYERTCSNKNATNGSYPKGLIVAFKLKSLTTEGTAEQKCTEAGQTEVSNSTGTVPDSEQKAPETESKDEKSSENAGNDNVEKSAEGDVPNTEENTTNDATEENKDKDEKSPAGEGKGKNDNDVVTREDLKLVFQKYGLVKYIDFKMGDQSGYVRFDDPEAAVKARAIAVIGEQGGLPVKNFIATLEALTGDAEKEYWNTLRSFQDKRRENTNNRGRGGRNHRGGRHFDGKRSRNTDSTDWQANKAQKIVTAD